MGDKLKAAKANPMAPFICTSEAALHALRYWLRERDFEAADGRVERRGKPAIVLRPAGHVIICADDEIRSTAMVKVEKELRARKLEDATP